MRNSRGVCCTCAVATEYRRLASWTKDRAAEALSVQRSDIIVGVNQITRYLLWKQQSSRLSSAEDIEKHYPAVYFRC